MNLPLSVATVHHRSREHQTRTSAASDNVILLHSTLHPEYKNNSFVLFGLPFLGKSFMISDSTAQRTLLYHSRKTSIRHCVPTTQHIFNMGKHRKHGHHHHHHHHSGEDSTRESSRSTSKVRLTDQYRYVQPERGASGSGSYRVATTSYYSSRPREYTHTVHSSRSGGRVRVVSSEVEYRHVPAPSGRQAEFIPAYQETGYDYTSPYHQESHTSYAPSPVSTQRQLPAPPDRTEHGRAPWDWDWSQTPANHEVPTPQNMNGLENIEFYRADQEKLAGQWMLEHAKVYRGEDRIATIEQWKDLPKDWEYAMTRLKLEGVLATGATKQEIEEMLATGYRHREKFLFVLNSSYLDPEYGYMGDERGRKGPANLFEHHPLRNFLMGMRETIDHWQSEGYKLASITKLQRNGHYNK